MMRLGRWSYAEAARVHFVERRAALLDGRAGAARLLVFAGTVPLDLFVTFPREIAAAWRAGRLDQLRYHVRGLWDGVLDRPLPLAELGLR
jgi:hypothetical protein